MTDAPQEREPAGSGDDAVRATQLPAVEIVGNATPEQVAALLSVLSAAGGGEAEPAPRPQSEWAAHEPRLRRPLHPGPGAWRSALRHI